MNLLNPAAWQGRVYANGQWQSAQGGTREVIEPATGERLTITGVADAADMTQAITGAAAAQPAWAALPPRDRAAVFHRAAAILQRHFDELALVITRETGAILPKGQHEVREAITLCQIAAGLPLAAQGQVLPSVPGRLSFARRVPHGVVGVI
jgi:benzaldehyde dehydrogenase (NAD)